MASRISLFLAVCLFVVAPQTITGGSGGDSGSRVLRFPTSISGRIFSLCSHGLFPICRLQMQQQHLQAALPPRQLCQI